MGTAVSVMPMMVGRGHAKGVKGRRRRKIAGCAVFIDLLKMCAELIAKSGELFKLLVAEAGCNAVCIFFAVAFYFAEQFLALIAKRDMRYSLVLFVRNTHNKLFLGEFAHHFRKGRGANIKKLGELVGRDAVMLTEQGEKPSPAMGTLACMSRMSVQRACDSVQFKNQFISFQKITSQNNS